MDELKTLHPQMSYIERMALVNEEWSKVADKYSWQKMMEKPLQKYTEIQAVQNELHQIMNKYRFTLMPERSQQRLNELKVSLDKKLNEHAEQLELMKANA